MSGTGRCSASEDAASRRLLWLAIAVVGLPLLFGGTGGCPFGSPAASVPINDTSYTCGRACAAASALGEGFPGTVNLSYRDTMTPRRTRGLGGTSWPP